MSNRYFLIRGELKMLHTLKKIFEQEKEKRIRAEEIAEKERLFEKAFDEALAKQKREKNAKRI